MLTRLQIQNFKAWEDTGTVHLAPLTVLFGANSSGKSSVNHFLMLLRQTARSPDRNNVFDFGDANAAVRLGSFREVIYRHDLEREMRFTAEWRLPSLLAVRDPRSGRRYTGDALAFQAAASQSRGRSKRVQSEGIRYYLTREGKLAIRVGMERDEERPNRWRLEARNYELIRNPGRAWELPRPVQFYGFPDEAALYYQNTAFLADLEFALQDLLGSISYLGPLRSPPERLYTWSGAEPEDVGWQGANAIPAILAARDRRFNWTRKARTVPFETVISRWLRELGLLHSFTVAEIAPERDEYEVRVKTMVRAEEVKLTDVGFGVSQVLPVIVQAFYAPVNSTVLMEQPELHLHPAVQASLADLFIAAITAREHGRPRQVQLIVESHSEHFLRRLQRRIAEEQIDESQVALYFCESGIHGSRMSRLKIDTYGDIHNWPAGFFGDELEDVIEQTDAKLQRRITAT